METKTLNKTQTELCLKLAKSLAFKHEERHIGLFFIAIKSQDDILSRLTSLKRAYKLSEMEEMRLVRAHDAIRSAVLPRVNMALERCGGEDCDAYNFQALIFASYAWTEAFLNADEQSFNALYNACEGQSPAQCTHLFGEFLCDGDDSDLKLIVLLASHI